MTYVCMFSPRASEETMLYRALVCLGCLLLIPWSWELACVLLGLGLLCDCLICVYGEE